MATQSSFTAAPVRALPGQLADEAPNDMISVLVDASASVSPGLVILRTGNGDFAGDVPSAVAVDDDSILVALATSASIQTLDTEADGVIALGRISPPRKITVTRSSHANQDAVTAVLSYLDQDGVPVSENLAFADAGGDSFTSTYPASRFVSLVIPAQAGTGGTTKIGTTAVSDVSLEGGDVLGVSVHTHKGLVDPSSSNNEKYEDGDVMPVLRHGRIFVEVENTFRAGDVAMVRLVAAGAERLGAIRANDTDSGDCAPLRRARFLTSGAGASGELGLLEIDL